MFWALLYRHSDNLSHADAQYLNFFFDDYNPRHWYWEVIECFRKLVLTGVALFFGEQGSLLQTAAVIWMVMCYIIVLLRVQPYKLPYDNHMALLTNVDMFIILFASLLIKVDTSFTATGRFVTGYDQNSMAIILILVVLGVVIAWVVTLVRDIREFNTGKSFRTLDDGALLVMPRLPREHFHVFISHSQQDGGDQVAHIKAELKTYIETISICTDAVAGRAERALPAKSQLHTAIERSSVFLVFLSKTYFTRKRCVKEFQAAIAMGKHIVIVLDTDVSNGGTELETFVEYATGQRARANTDAITGASNLWNQATRSGDTECVDLCEWVAKHVQIQKRVGTAASHNLCICAFAYHCADGTVVQVPEQCYSVTRWFRNA